MHRVLKNEKGCTDIFDQREVRSGEKRGIGQRRSQGGNGMIWWWLAPSIPSRSLLLRFDHIDDSLKLMDGVQTRRDIYQKVGRSRPLLLALQLSCLCSFPTPSSGC